MKGFKLSRRAKYGSMAILLTVLLVVGIIGVNAVLTIITDRLNLTVDMTEEKRYELSEASLKLIRGLEKKINIYIIGTEDGLRTATVYQDSSGAVSYGTEIVELFRKYNTMSNGNITVEYVDITKNPTFLNRFPGIGEVSAFSVIVSSEKGGYRVITLHELYYWYYDNDYTSQPPVGINVERRIASAILYVDEGQKRKAVFTKGKGEMEPIAFATFLLQNNFDIDSISLNTDKIPEDTDLLVINAPTLDYTAADLDKVEAYLKKQNTTLIVSMDPSAGKLPELEKFISDYGIDFGEATIYDSRVATGAENILAVLTDDEMLAGLPETSTNIVFPATRPITLNEGRPTEYKSRAILKSSDSSYSKVFGRGASESVAKAAGDADGPFIIAAVSKYEYFSTDYETVNQILALGSGYALSDEVLKSQSYSNQEFLSAVFKDFYGNPDISQFDGKEFTTPEMLIIDWMKPVYLVILMVLPLALLAAGIVVWLRRKNK